MRNFRGVAKWRSLTVDTFLFGDVRKQHAKAKPRKEAVVQGIIRIYQEGFINAYRFRILFDPQFLRLRNILLKNKILMNFYEI